MWEYSLYSGGFHFVQQKEEAEARFHRRYSAFLADFPTSHTQEKKTKTMLPGVVFLIQEIAFFGYFIKDLTELFSKSDV